METRFYGRSASEKIVPPSEPDLDNAHHNYILMAASSLVTDGQRWIFKAARRCLFLEQRVEAIMFGGTDFALVFNEQYGFPAVDWAGIHADAIARLAIA